MPSKQAQHGDYQSNFAFRLARSQRQAPRKIAERIVEAWPEHPAVERLEVAGAGFINVHLSRGWLSS